MHRPRRAPAARAQHHRGRAVDLRRAALQQRQRVGDHARGQHLFDRRLGALLRVLVERAVDGGSSPRPRPGRPASRRARAGSACRASHRRRAAPCRPWRRARSCGRCAAAGSCRRRARQLLDAEHQHGVVLLGEQRVARQVHAGGAAGAGVLDVVDRDAARSRDRARSPGRGSCRRARWRSRSPGCRVAARRRRRWPAGSPAAPARARARRRWRPNGVIAPPVM